MASKALRKTPPPPDPKILRHQVGPPEFDLYAVTAPDGDYRKFFEVVERAVGGCKKVMAPAGGFYEQRQNLVKDGRSFGHIAWGGHNRKYPKLEVSGSVTPAVVHELRSLMRGMYQVPAVHSCVDFVGADLSLYLRLKALGVQIKRMDTRVRGRPIAGDDDFPDDFHAYGIGSEENAYVSIYEAGKVHRALGQPYWVRIEARCRPKGEMKKAYADLEPHEIWGATRFMRWLASSMFDQSIEPHPYRPILHVRPEQEKLYTMSDQYRKSICKYLELPGHTPESLGRYVASSAMTAYAIHNAQKERYLIGGTNNDCEIEMNFVEGMMN
jgi:hypothetical protein